jgi:hypothetical protein
MKNELWGFLHKFGKERKILKNGPIFIIITIAEDLTL